MSCLSIEQLDNGDIIISKVVTFDYENKKKYIELFDKNVEDGILKEGYNFFDNEWIVIIGGVEYKIILLNDIQLKKYSKIFGMTCDEFNLSYRSFLLFNLYIPKAVIRFNMNFKKLIDTGTLNKATAFKIVSMVDKFLKYISIPKKNISFFDCILEQDFSDIQSKSAEIPSFESIFLITDIVNDIVENKELRNYKEHLLFIMWWKICSILPLRPSEFLATNYSCIYEENNKFYLTVLRTKAKIKQHISNMSKKEEYYKEDTVMIDYSLFKLIQSYQEILTEEFGYEEKVDLFPFELVENIGNYKLKTRELNTNKIIVKDITYGIDRFYKYVIGKEYGFKTVGRYEKIKSDTLYIENINARDLRHIAIINLVLIGCDVLDTMRLAGHTNVNTAMGYYNHVKEFSKGAALGYMNSIRNRQKMESKNIDLDKKNTSSQIKVNERKEEFNQIMNLVNGEESIVTPVDGGNCHYSSLEDDKSFCIYYEGDHAACPYFVHKNKSILQKQIEDVEKKVDSNIRILKDLISDMNKISKFNELYQTTSFELTKNIKDMVYLNNKMLKEEEDNG